MKASIPKFIVSTVPADGLKLLVAGASADSDNHDWVPYIYGTDLWKIYCKFSKYSWKLITYPMEVKPSSANRLWLSRLLSHPGDK